MVGQQPESSTQEQALAAIPGAGARPLPRQLVFNATLVASVVVVACGLGILSRPDHQLAAFWPANALLLGLLARRPQLASPAGWAAAFLGFLAADLLTGTSLPTALRLTAANLAGVVAGYLAFRQIRREDKRLQHPLSMLWVLAASMVAASAAAAVGALSAHSLVHVDMAKAVGMWFSGELVSYVTILPVVLLAPSPVAFVREAVQYAARAHRSPHLLLPLASLVVAVLIGVWIGGPGAIAFPVPALLWCALAYRLFTTALVSLLLCVWTLIAIAYGLIDLQLQHDAGVATISLRMGMALLAVAPLTVAGVDAARNQLLIALNHAATHDALTGALNRSAFLHRGRNMLVNAAHAGDAVAVMMLDIDHFKIVNDHHGHAAGDTVLAAFTQRMQAQLRDDDLLGRFGGEEFAVLMPGLGASAADAVAERLRRAASAPVPLPDGRMLDITVSVGLSVLGAGRQATLEALLNGADHALYRAKAMGRDRVVSRHDEELPAN